MGSRGNHCFLFGKTTKDARLRSSASFFPHPFQNQLLVSQSPNREIRQTHLGPLSSLFHQSGGLNGRCAVKQAQQQQQQQQQQQDLKQYPHSTPASPMHHQQEHHEQTGTKSVEVPCIQPGPDAVSSLLVPSYFLFFSLYFSIVVDWLFLGWLHLLFLLVHSVKPSKKRSSPFHTSTHHPR